jgi:hypothetical protein
VQWKLILSEMSKLGFFRSIQSIKNHWYSFLMKKAARRQVDLTAFTVQEEVLARAEALSLATPFGGSKRAAAGAEAGTAVSATATAAARKEAERDAEAKRMGRPPKTATAPPARAAGAPSTHAAAPARAESGSGSGAAGRPSGSVYANIEWRRMGDVEMPAKAAFALHLHGGMLRFLDAAGGTITDRAVSRVKLGQELAGQGVPPSGWTVFPDGRLVAHDNHWAWEG